MITKPSMSQLLEAMKAELTDKIIPGLSDPTLVVNVQMMTAVLGALAVRVEHELEWMRDECERIDAVATDTLAGRDDAALRGVLDEYRSARSGSLVVSEAQADYNRASEVLSHLAELAYASGDTALVSKVEGLYESRLATEQAAIGTFVAVGR